MLWQGAKTTDSVALVTRRNSILVMSRNTDPNAKIRDIVRRNVTESAHAVINKLSGQGRKRKGVVTYTKIGGGGNVKMTKKQPKAKKIKTDQSKRGK